MSHFVEQIEFVYLRKNKGDWLKKNPDKKNKTN